MMMMIQPELISQAIDPAQPAETVEVLAARIVEQAVLATKDLSHEAAITIDCPYNRELLHPNLVSLVILLTTLQKGTLRYGASCLSEHRFTYSPHS